MTLLRVQCCEIKCVYSHYFLKYTTYKWSIQVVKIYVGLSTELSVLRLSEPKKSGWENQPSVWSGRRWLCRCVDPTRLNFFNFVNTFDIKQIWLSTPYKSQNSSKFKLFQKESESYVGWVRSLPYIWEDRRFFGNLEVSNKFSWKFLYHTSLLLPF